MCYVDEETKERLTLRHAVFSEADEYGIRDLLEVIVDGVKYGRGGGTSVTTMYSQAAWLRRCRHCNVKADNFTYSKNIDGYRFTDEDFC